MRKGAGICVAAPTEPADATMLSRFQPTNLEQVQMLFAYRRLIESEGASRAAMRANPQQVRELVALAAASADAAGRDDEAAFATLDADFHAALAAGAGNLFIEASVSMVRSYSGQVGRLLFRGQKPGSLVVAGAQHQDIAAGVAAGDPAAAAQALVLHIDTTEAQFERRLLERLSYVDEPGSPSHG